MKKKLLSVFAAAAVMLAAGCSGNAPAQTTAASQETTAAQTTEAPAESSAEETEVVEDNGSQPKSLNASLFMSVKGSDGKMSISRAPKKSTSMGDAGKWTIFVYLCGTDLESEDGQGAATGDMAQMLSATASDKVRFVVQTGGTSEWMNEMFRNDACERYLVENGDINLVDSAALTSMGDADTLSSFLSWGVDNFASEKMGVIMWNHGGGSISGVCFDELHDRDSLSLSEINTALSKVYANMTDKFEFIGFDCCLMGTAESANILATYARYFYGSQETEPGCGWNYTAIGNFLAKNPSANGGELGKIVADSFYEDCVEIGDSDCVTFSIIDLEKFDDFTIAFNDYAKALYEASQKDLAGVVRGVNKADNFGGNNKADGYTNMVDVGGIVNNCSSYADGSAVLNALKNCIVYIKNSTDHKNASGLSIYYPLQIQGTSELKTFSGICISPYYLSLVDMVAKGYSDNGYTNEVFFTEDGDWSSEDCSCDTCDDDTYFDCDESSCGSGNSNLISFEDDPGFNEDGCYGFSLTDSAYEYTESVSATVYMHIDDETVVDLGETDDIDADWDSGTFYDNFDGKWLSLSDGQPLATYIVDYTDDYTIYSCPIELNGKQTNLRLRLYSGEKVVVEGAWDGINANGVAAREIKKLKAGDRIAPVYTYYVDDEQDDYVADAYSWTGSGDIGYKPLYEGDYEYGFDIYDVYGDCCSTDSVVFSIDENGEISYNEE